MTEPDTLPDSLRAWAQGALGSFTATPVATAGDGSVGRLWEAVRHQDAARFFVKIAYGPASYTRETFAYRHAVPALGCGRAPRLQASSAERLALIVTAAPGTPLARLHLADGALEAAHRKAGALLCQLHQAGRPAGAGRPEASTALRRAADATAEHLEAAGNWLSPQEQQVVLSRADELRVVGRLPLGYIHGDAQESHLMWAGRTQPPALIDFGRSRFAPVVQDFVPLACGTWADRPRLRTAFFQGYGRALSREEQRALDCLMALYAARCLAWGRARNAPEAAARGRRVIDRLMDGASV
ncbi:hypothetical protein AQI88_30870 [Streptomyces cellostaticus]|uniref:Aminoglycoside phosphotransferase domain-containing protein n=1 Tax=Streptomyces cellostaticus TaxID=67285 RepID=A0A101NFY9_9ACTN|nr:aminoglycoside phosphotransferase family protein [Streptomyces cellostaticus]KUM92578.1 hypothetical protein AQI88_30870 [Streptomyces cellostaticus]GHI10467.1 hypothetical protein Scel_87880 [Streptomyces cellostaticus]